MEEQALNTLGSHAEKVRSCYVLDKYCALFVKATSDEFQIYYSENTCFEDRELQFWIFAQFKDFVLKTEDIHPPKTGISVHFSGSLV